MLTIMVNAIVLVGTSLLPFIIGSIFAKEKLFSKLSSNFRNIKHKNGIGFFGIISLVIIHSLYEFMIIAPFTGIAFICIFVSMNKSKIIEKVLLYISHHSTNIWLIHMFFYISFFKELTFAPKYPLFIFVWLIFLCLISSHIINFIYYPIAKFVDKYFSRFGRQDSPVKSHKAVV